MTQYHFTAVPIERGSRAAVTGTREARDERELRDQLRTQGLIPISVRPSRFIDAFTLSLSGRGVSRADASWIFATLAFMLESAVPVEEAVRTMEDIAPNPRVAAVLGDIAGDLRGGAALSDALAAREGLTQPQHAAIVRSGERSGQLARVVALVARSMATAQALRRTLISRMIYPALLLATAVIVVWALGVFVVPRFAETLEALGGELPWQTAFTLGAADALVWAVPALALTAAGLFALRSRILGPAARRTIARRSLSVPIVGSLIWHRHAAMICDTVATMIEGGGDVLAGVDQAIDVCTQPELKRRLTSARESVREGVSLDEALRAQQVLPKMLTAVVSVGLRSGELGSALRRAAELAMEKQDTMSQRLLTLLEPAVIAIMAGAVFWVVYSLIKGMLAMSEGAL